ncbi:fatty acid desaturase [Tateyamaria pelophila]|uniref:fatty acid desaturase n=1 Tax=Tateyamaria pelophila TaxID=328415 RepID=UPI001CBB27CC|nr:fatty acid desaturase [Tateyamaria pelophila]
MTNLPSSRRHPKERPAGVEWITLGLYALCVSLWGAGVFAVPSVSLALAAVVICLALVLHGSLTHEVVHGHPFPSFRLSEMLVILNPGLFIPYLRFRDTHLAHHQDAKLTDPYDDPESNYFDPVVWARLPGWHCRVLAFNNTLLGRIVIGPLVGQMAFMRADAAAIRADDRQVLKGWLLHLPSLIGIPLLVWASSVPLWLYFGMCYAAMTVLKIRTFLEHQAHALARGRTVIIEDRGVLAFLFLNNNFHVVHHMHPQVPWYRLPAVYRANRDRYLRSNEGYLFTSYRDVFARYFLRAKDPVPHPLWPSEG